MDSSRTLSKPAILGRRDFLKSSAISTGVVALGGLDISRCAQAAGGDTLRVGMIGCGGRNTGAAAQALTADRGARLVAMGDIFMDRIRSKRQTLQSQMPQQVQVPDDACFTGFDAYQKVIELSDVVLIANGAKFHPLHAMAAVRAGRHVFVEKPHGIDPYGVRMMQAACDLAQAKGLSRNHAVSPRIAG